RSGAVQILPVTPDRDRVSEGSRDYVAAVEIRSGALQPEISRIDRAAEPACRPSRKLRGFIDRLAVAVADAVEEATAGAFAQGDLTGAVDRVGAEVPVIHGARAKLGHGRREIGSVREEVRHAPVGRIVVVLPAKVRSL